MSFGNINKILDKTYQLVSINKNVTSQDLIIIKNKIQKEIPSATPQIIDEIFNRLVTPSFTLKNEICFDNGVNCFREFEESYPDIKVPTKYKKLSDHFNKLQNLPQPAQRSKEWYDYRYNRITASDMAAAIDMNPYEPV